MPKHPRRYPWPASRLRELDVMHSLHLESLRTSKPITVIIQEAVCAHLNQRLDQPKEEHPVPIGFTTGSAQQTVA